ncbi:MAG: class I SAM-dependent methyltransferase [Methylocystaceae bacterium]|nr:class I SAM-dependent methyltransferase [Methylocystaceae bacterium]
MCGNVQHIKYYNEQSLILFYSNVFRDIYGRQTPAEIFEGQVERGHQLVWFCTDYLKEDAAVLEIGTGCGGILKAFQEKGCRVTGVDFDPRFIEYGQKQGLDVRKGDISAVDSAEKFDLIIISHVLEYIVEPVPFLQKAMDHLAVGGQIYIEVPSLDHVAEGGYNYDLLNYYQNAHVIHFSVATLTTLLHKVGLKILKNDNFICCLVSKSEEEVKDIEANFSDMRKKQIRLIDSIEKKRTSLLGRVCRKIKNKFMS